MQASPENLALNRPVTVSGTDFSPTLPEFAVDGDAFTFWRAEPGQQDSWIEVDLQATCLVGEVVLVSPSSSEDPAERHPRVITTQWLTGEEILASHATAYRVELSADGTTWREVHRTASGKGGTERIVFEPAPARYVRVTASALSGPEGWGVGHLAVLGSCSSTRPPQDGWKIRRKAKGPRPDPRLAFDAAGHGPLDSGWELLAEESLADGAATSSPGLDTRAWYDATVPGTVLATLVDQEVFPDPVFGLNNLQIPEALCQRPWWYRRSFVLARPPTAGERFHLHFEGINYAAEVWCNGARLGEIHGAFRRGEFDVTDLLKNGENVIAVRILPLIWNGIPFEQTAVVGTGKNGGMTTRNGPTFSCTIGWDWLPGIRDRNLGIWNGVCLRASGPVTLADPQVTTRIALPDLSRADLTIRVGLRNATSRYQTGSVAARVEGLSVSQPVSLAPGERREVVFDPARFPELTLHQPRLWWPNGYGKPELYDLELTLSIDGAPGDRAALRFGVREIGWERPAPQPALARADAAFRPRRARFVRLHHVMAETHAGFSLREFALFGPETAGRDLARGCATTGTLDAEGVPASRAIDGSTETSWGTTGIDPIHNGPTGRQTLDLDLGEERLLDRVVLDWGSDQTYGGYYWLMLSRDGKEWEEALYGPNHLHIPWGDADASRAAEARIAHPRDMYLLVNGVRVFCRGGNWGMDEALKRAPRARLEAFIRMHRDAHVTMIRNWVGQSTSRDFFDLCDENGILVWNDFWLANPNDGPEPEDAALFLDNARDTVLRYRNHPSIALWCGRNEGWPRAEIDRGLDQLVSRLDGTRLYQSASDREGVHGRGPYWHVPPRLYFERLAHGFTSEIGTPSVPTAESIRGMFAPAAAWPADNRPLKDDVWAYHDYCVKGAQRCDHYHAALERSFGPPTGLDDFCRKAQLLNYESHRAIFEAWNSRLWDDCGGALLWMSHPSFPSTVWQLYAYDLEPTAALFGTQKGGEPIHVQWNPHNGDLDVINHTQRPLGALACTARLLALDGSPLHTQTVRVDAAANARTRAAVLEKPAALPPARFLKLELRDASGLLLSENFYWDADRDEDLRALNALPPAPLALRAAAASGTRVRVAVENASGTVALMTRVTLRRAGGERVLPAFASDNYLSLLPGERREIAIDHGGEAGPLRVTVDGWNIAPAGVDVAPA